LVQTTPTAEETTFQIFPIFVDTNYSYNDSASSEALAEYSNTKLPDNALDFTASVDVDKCYSTAKECLEKLCGEQMPWEENITLLNVAWTLFV
jgi:hypothetical protein